jgi:L-methionine (R)-S-oxide reductase
MSSNDMTFEEVLKGAGAILQRGGDASEVLLDVCRLLEGRVPHYDWVGFYISDPKERILHLGPYVGAPTDHVRIPFGRGICGQAAERKRTFIVQDVTKEVNYLSCSPSVRSEIVLPIMDGMSVIGELDIDSHSISPFTGGDRELLERICSLCAPLVRTIRGEMHGPGFKYK